MALPIGAPLVDLSTGNITAVWLRAFFNAANALSDSGDSGQETASTFGLYDPVVPLGPIRESIADLDTRLSLVAEPTVSRGDIERLRDTILLLEQPVRHTPPVDPWLSYLVN